MSAGTPRADQPKTAGDGGTNVSPLAAARLYHEAGLAVTPAKGKAPHLTEWQKKRVSAEELPHLFGPGVNVGVLNGEPSGGLVDVDLDCAEAIACAPAWLPPTACVFGHGARARSHYVYRVTGPLPRTRRYEDPRNVTTDKEGKRKGVVVELRAAGTQTIWPGSVHAESGEPIVFASSNGGDFVVPDIAKVDGAELAQSVLHVAASALIARHWECEGGRHTLALHYGGFLAQLGVAVDIAAKLIEVAAGVAEDEEVEERVRAVRDSAEKHARDEGVTGRKELAELVGEEVVKALEKLLPRSVPKSRARGTGAARTGTTAANAGGGQLRAATVLAMLGSANVAAFHSPEGEAYVTLDVRSHSETWLVESKVFQKVLSNLVYRQTQVVPPSQVMGDVLNTLAGQAHAHLPARPVFTRVGHHGERVYLDLCDDEWRVVEIDAEGWRVLPKSPVALRRSGGMQPLPMPTRGGSLEALRPFLNLATDEDWMLCLAAIVGALNPTGPYPILVLNGEQGSAKSTTAGLIRRIVDPNQAPLRGAPADDRDLLVAARHSHFLAFDNLSTMPPWLSDALCRLATGSGYAPRSLHTNADEFIFQATRPVILNGITEIARRSDLVDRAIILQLPPIDPGARQTDAQLREAFAAAWPGILGAVLDAVSMALARRPTVQLSSTPRLADFAVWVEAAAPALGWAEGAFLAAYEANRERASDDILADDLVAQGVFELLEPEPAWEGTMGELLTSLEFRVGVVEWRELPKNARALREKLTRIAPNLRQAGVHVEFGARGSKGRQVILRRDGSQGDGRWRSSVGPMERKCLEFPWK